MYVCFRILINGRKTENAVECLDLHWADSLFLGEINTEIKREIKVAKMPSFQFNVKKLYS